MSARDDLKAALAAAGLAPSHRLGQNFMVDNGALQDLVSALEPSPGERVLEVGPGTGRLTERLLAAELAVLAIELDAGLHALLGRTLAPALTAGTLQLIHGDVLADKNHLHPEALSWLAAGPWKLGANLPYDVAIPVVLNALGLPRPPELIAVTVQWEAAQRLCSRPGSKAWGATAAVAQAAGSGSTLRRLPPSCFHPRPRVDSAILVWRSQRRLPEGFSRFVRQLFAYRRKLLPRALRDCGLERERAHSVIAAAAIDPALRVETLPVEALLQLHLSCQEQEDSPC